MRLQLDAIDRIQNPWWLCHNGWDLNVIEMASSSQGDNCLIFPVPLYTVTTVGIIKSYESFDHINRVVITKGNIVDKIMVFSILLFMNLQNGIYAISTVSDSLVVQIEDL